MYVNCIEKSDERKMKMNKENRKWSDESVRLYIILVTVLSLIVETIFILSGIGYLMLLLMWVPAICANVANIVSIRQKGERFTLKKHFSDLGLGLCHIKYILLGFILPIIYLLIPYMIYWKMHPDNFAYNGVALNLILADCLPVLLLGTVVNMISAAGEEIGWRGFMVPSFIERIGLKKTLLFTGLFWALWHLPLLIFGGYMAETAMIYRMPAFILCILPIGIIAGLLAYRSRSVWPAVVLHAAHNNLDQGILDVITRGEDRMYYVSETGMLTIICTWVLALIMYLTFTKKEEV